MFTSAWTQTLFLKLHSFIVPFSIQGEEPGIAVSSGRVGIFLHTSSLASSEALVSIGRVTQAHLSTNHDTGTTL